MQAIDGLTGQMIENFLSCTGRDNEDKRSISVEEYLLFRGQALQEYMKGARTEPQSKPEKIQEQHTTPQPAPVQEIRAVPKQESIPNPIRPAFSEETPERDEEEKISNRMALMRSVNG